MEVATKSEIAKLASVTKGTDGAKVFTVQEAFNKSVGNGLADMLKAEPIAMNLFLLHQRFCGPDAKKEEKITELVFFHGFDATIPTVYGGVGTPERKKVDSHSGLGKLRRFKQLGARLINGGKKKIDAATRKAQTKKNVKQFGNWASKFNVGADALTALLTLMKRKDAFINAVLAEAGFEKATKAAKKVTRKKAA